MARFMTAAWAADCQAAVNGWPTDAARAGKLAEFWEWIEQVSAELTGPLALSVRDMPAGSEGDTLVLDLDGGRVTAATVTSRPLAEPGAMYLLAGRHADWLAMLDGYDVGKTVMYRKLMLEKGDTLKFFMAAFFWTELLAAIQSVTTEPAPALAG
jgi:hypothetical protein